MIDITKLLSPTDTVSVQSMDRIRSAVVEAITAEREKIESEYSNRFEKLVENISQKFDDKVQGVIVESVKENIGNNVNNKMYSLVRDMVGLLENSGIATTEKTKELQEKLKVADEKLEIAYNDRMEIKDKLDHAAKDNYIMRQLAGSHPKIISHALEYFKNKDMMDVQDGIEAFASGDFSQLMDDNDGDEVVGDMIHLDQVRDVLNDITDEKDKKGGSMHESIGRGLKPLRATGGPAKNPNTQQALTESAEGVNVEEDVGEAMTRIYNYDNMGWRFK